MAANSTSVILVGCGNMGRAMLQGWLRSEILRPKDVHVVEPSAELRNGAVDLGVSTYPSASDLPDGIAPTLIIFAVKPQVMFEITPAYSKYVDADSAVVSVAAGVSTASFEEAFGAKVAVIRVMPNTPAAVSKGMMVIFRNEATQPDQMVLVEKLMSANGVVATIEDEVLMDAVTAVSGSGPAYLFHMIEALCDAGVAAGLSGDMAKLLAEQTIYGAACYAKSSDAEPGMLRKQVTSPNGTTAAALDVLMRDDALKTLMRDAVAAAKKRSEELG